MVLLNFLVDKEKQVEIVTREDMVGKVYSLLKTSNRCSAIHAYSSTCGCELDLETNDVKVGGD